MSFSLTQNPEVESALRKQRARATISSLFISILVVVLVALILTLVFIPALTLDQPDIVAYRGATQVSEQLEPEKVSNTMQRKPSAPSRSMARVIASNTASPTAVPVPDVSQANPALEFGSSDDFGAGWSTGGEESGAGGTTFFGVKSEAGRVAFVIDYSLSMRGEREDIMREELQKAVEDLAPGTKYQMIFFAGPVWVAGSEIAGSENETEQNFIKADGKTYRWSTNGGVHNFEPRGGMQSAEWIELPQRGKEKKEAVDVAKGIIQDTRLVYGTRWKYALQMALDMRLPPQVIYFMTDGESGREAMQVAREVGRKAKNRGIIINTVAMMEPRAHEAMLEMAKSTGGNFTIVKKGGERTQVPLK